MKIAITGASGFVGTGIVQQALANGHRLLAFSRTAVRAESANGQSQLEHVTLDLLADDIPEACLSGCDALIHLAISQGSDREGNTQNTLAMTLNILDAAYRDGVRHYVVMSSISVLDYSLPAYSTIDASTPLNPNTKGMGDYAYCKREQELAVKKWAQTHDCSLNIVRPGLIYSDDNYSDAHAGFVKKGFGFAVQHKGQVPVVSLESCAQQVLELLERGNHANATCTHILDAELPKQKEYLLQLKNHGGLKLALPLPWQIYTNGLLIKARIMQSIGLNKLLPDALKPASLQARAKPFEFSS